MIPKDREYAVILYQPSGIYHASDIIRSFKRQSNAESYATRLYEQGENVVVRTIKYIQRNPKTMFPFTWDKPGYAEWDKKEKEKAKYELPAMPLWSDEKLDAYQRMIHGLPPKRRKRR